MWFWKRKEKRRSAPSRSDVREFIRHTVDVPIEYSRVAAEDADELGDLLGNAGAGASRDARAPRGDAHDAQSVNVGFGGLAFTTDECPTAGDLIELRIPTVEPPFVARARVAWCRPEDGQWLVGASFLDASDAFRSRMVQQVCSIENYRKDVLEKEGRELTTQEASAEWIARFANRFPTAGSKPTTPDA